MPRGRPRRGASQNEELKNSLERKSVGRQDAIDSSNQNSNHSAESASTSNRKGKLSLADYRKINKGKAKESHSANGEKAAVARLVQKGQDLDAEPVDEIEFDKENTEKAEFVRRR